MGAIDADAHVVECERTSEYIDPEYLDLKPRVMVPKTDDMVELDNEGLAQQRESRVFGTHDALQALSV